ncbi:MAG: lipid-binding SYLF domain-containing protein [Proteobacteria bacterium]|nr:lipid-binding SYLF domain-containing protein [Pseudomonadota bacterium]
MPFRNTVFAACLVSLAPLLASCTSGGPGSGAQQDIVDRSTLALQEILNSTQSRDVVDTLRSARAVIICPQVFKAGFVIGGSGGNCVLMARAAGGSWSDPAFYKIGSGSFGAQVGIQDAEVMIMIMNDRALNAVMQNHFKIGGDASLAFASVGAGVGGATTTALRADIVSFSRTRGLYAGVSIEGSVLSPDTESDTAYYGQPYNAPQIVVQMMANNPGANPLRATLSRYGG